MPAKRRLLKGEAQFVVPGAVSVKLSKFPGKRGSISTYPDSWSVVLEVEQAGGTNTMTLLAWDDEPEKARDYYDRLREFFGGKT